MRKPSKIFKKAGTVFDLAGHLHGWQGGKNLTVYKNDEVVHVFHSNKSTTTPFLYEIRHLETPFRVAAGDRLSIEATYSNPHTTATRGVMGIVGFYYTEE